ncbi:MAG: PCI domain-containing protein [Nannocystaceae bacterium]|nr:PCI domain-containing protein [Nannocystaceae bacterium]
MDAPVPAAKPSRVLPGVVLLALGATCNAVGIGLTVSPKREGDPSAGIFWIVVSVVAMMVPGIILITMGRRQARRGRQIDTIVALASAAQRLPFAQLAVDLGCSESEARKLLLEAIGAGRIVGRLDLDKGAFVSGSTHGGVQQLTMTCRSCGGTSVVIVTASSVSLCQYCGFRLA